MKTTKFISLIAISLFILNLVLLYFLFLQKEHHLSGERPKKVIIEKLKFDANQVSLYQNLIDQHRTDMQAYDVRMMDLKNQMYINLKSGRSDTISDSLLSEIGKIQIEIEKNHFNHFKDIKLLCAKDQLPSYDQLISEIAVLFAKPKMKK